MRYEVEINGRRRRVDVNGAGSSFDVAVDGRSFRVDVARIDAHTLSLLVGGARSYEVTVAPDPTSARLAVQVGTTPFVVALDGRGPVGRREDEAHPGTGPQRILAPMPGKVVRVLVGPGQTVRARQALVVVEAMKMENELRAGRDGTVVEIHARAGASIEAGGLLVVIE